MRGFLPTAPSRALGSIGDVEEYGDSRSVTLLVGRNKGKDPANRTGRCRTLPEEAKTVQYDELFIEARAAQIGRENVGATRTEGKGWYRGDPEKAVAYQVAFVPSPREKTYEAFKRNMNRLAESLATKLCQDSILVVRDDGRRRTVAGASRKRAKPASA